MKSAYSLNKVDILFKVIEISNSTIDPGTKLQNILECVVRELNIDQAFIFGLDKEFNNLVLRATHDATAEWPDQKVIPMGFGLVGSTAQNRRFSLVHHKAIEGESPFWADYGTRLAFPIMDDTFLYGILSLLFKNPIELESDVISLLNIICLQLSGSIRYFRLSMEAKRRIAEQSALFEIGKVISSTTDLQKLVDEVVIICAKAVSARSALLTIFDTPKNDVIVKSAFGQRHVQEALPLCMTLSFQNSLEGTLCVYEKLSWEDGHLVPFDEDDHHLLMALASFLSSALGKSLVLNKMEGLVAKNQMLVKRLATLYAINSEMMTTIDQEQLLDIILEAVVTREGLRFDRAFVLLLDEHGTRLSVHKGIVRASLSAPKAAIENSSDDVETIARDELHPIDQTILNLSIPMDEHGGPLSLCLMHKQPMSITVPVEEVPENCRVLYDFLGSIFAAVPLMAKNKPIGVIVVDCNISKKPITQPSLRTLSMLAHQAGLALENSRLYAFIEGVNKELTETREKLIEAEKMAALGEIAAGIAHEIRNPLVSIGGFARRVLKTVGEDSPIREYLAVIVKEVERLEKTLREVLSFAQEADDGRFEFIDLHVPIEAALSYMRLEFEGSAISITKEYSKVPMIYGDDRQLRHLFFNLFLNARQAMRKGGQLIVRTYQSQDDYKRHSFVVVEVSDSGGGIPPNLLQKIFNPFFTSKPQGTGLGLSIVHRIIQRHQGDIEVDNRPGQGVSFIIKIPVIPLPVQLSLTK